MKLLTFIRENETELDRIIHRVNPGFDINDNERELWILNDESLWNWAKDSGVDLE